MFKTTIALCFFCCSITSYAQTNPEVIQQGSYTLEIPQADFQNIPGYYQNAKFSYHAATQHWSLDSVDRTIPSSIVSVELIRTNTLPVQLFIKITGGLTNGCQEPGQHSILQNGNQFEIYQYLKPLPNDVILVCTANYRTFSRTIPLPVYGLAAGSYQYKVNGGHFGYFSLELDNTLD